MGNNYDWIELTPQQVEFVMMALHTIHSWDSYEDFIFTEDVDNRIRIDKRPDKSFKITVW